LRITIKDVAERAGVDPSTVSRVINNDRGLSVRKETSLRILEVIKELGYQPNSIARNLRRQTSDAVGMLIPDIINPLFPEIIKGIESSASAKDLSVILCNTDDDPEKELKMIRFLLGRMVDGFLLASVHMRDETIAEVEKSGIPYVLVNRGNRKGSGAYVVADNAAGARLAVQHLIDLGHKRIAHIAGFLYTDTGIERLEGYRKVLNGANIPFNPEYMVETGYKEAEGYKAMSKMLRLPDRPTAVFAANDLLAMGAMLAINEKGLRVPEDISVVGFDDIWVAERITPALTTVKVSLYEMGRLAMDILFNKMKGFPLEQERIVLESSLVIRHSTAEVKS
jgi:LacI family transcriptional regulator